jgi:IPT/TIG domain
MREGIMAPNVKRFFLIAGFFYLSLGLVGCGGGGGGTTSPAPATIKVSISPSTASITADSTQQFTTTVANTTNKQVTWAVSRVTGGNSTVGSISAQGLYTAPDPLPDPASVTVTATSQADTTKSASANVSLTYAPPSVSSISPNYTLVNSSETTLTIAGSGFSKASTVSFGSNSLTTTYVSSIQLTAVLPAADASAEGKFSLAVANPSPGAALLRPESLTYTAQP